jgi:predicted HAD superfamily Cof-like phosphohydrolase
MYNDVVKFIEACDQEQNDKNASLYRVLINEEYEEFIESVYYDSPEDNVETLDACMDMIWVILGYCHMKGYDIAGAWDEVVKTNMAKVDPVTGKVRRREDGKILKPEGWQPPNMTKFIGD